MKGRTGGAMVRELLVSSMGLGFLRPAPGTWGSLPPAAIAFLMLTLGASGFTINIALIALLMVSCAICVALGGWAERRFGKKDASQIVIDETAGQCLPLLVWPASFVERCRGFASDGSPDWAGLARGAAAVGAAFVLFRVMDIVKPPPAHGLQRLRAGWGVLVDDLVAGLYAAAALQVGLRVLV